MTTQELFDKAFVATDDSIADIKERLKLIYADKINRMKKQQLTVLVKQGIKKAKQYEINSAFDVTRFIEAKLVLGKELETKTVYKKILNNDKLSGTQKINKIEEIILFED